MLQAEPPLFLLLRKMPGVILCGAWTPSQFFPAVPCDLAGGGSLRSPSDINSKVWSPFCGRNSLQGWCQPSFLLPTLSPAPQAAEIDERRVQSCVHFMTLKKLNRLAHIRLKKGRDQTHEVPRRGWE